MTTTIVSSIVGLVCTIVSSGVTFLWQKRKYNTEVDSQQIRNIEDSFNVYKKMMESNIDAQKDTFETIIGSLNQKVENLEKENASLREQVGQLQMEMISVLGSICMNTTCKMRKPSPTPISAKKGKSNKKED